MIKYCIIFQLIKANAQYSNMDAVDSITYAGSVSNLRDLDVEEIKSFKNYQFKGPSDPTNKLEIHQFKKPVIYFCIYKLRNFYLIE